MKPRRLPGPVVHPTRRRCLFPAEEPNGPFRTCPVTTEAVAAPLHPFHVAPEKPNVVAPIRRASPVRSVRQERRRLGRAELAHFCMSHALSASAAQAIVFARRRK